MRITVKMFGDGRKEGVFFVIRRIGNDIAVCLLYTSDAADD